MPWYVYGVTRTVHDTPPPAIEGIEEVPVRILGSGALQAVASDVSPAFGDMAGMTDDDVVTAVRRHDDVLQHVSRDRALLPVRFGTVLADDAAVEDMLSDLDGSLRQALDGVADADEWVITVAVATTGPGASVDEDLAPGHAFFARRRSAIEERRMARARAVAVAQDLDARLQALARDSRPLDLRDRETVARGAYLVPRHEAGRLVDAVQADGQAHIELQGPLPPYRFARTRP